MDPIARIGGMLAALFIGAGVGHATAPQGAVMVENAHGVSLPAPLARLGGVLFLAGGLGVLLGVAMTLALFGLAALGLIAATVVHAPWRFEGAGRDNSTVHLVKNVSLAGACVAAAGLVAGTGRSGWSMTERVLER